MGKSHKDKAMNLQKQALKANNNFSESRKKDMIIAKNNRLTNHSSRYGRGFTWSSDESACLSNQSIGYQKKTSELYELAGDEWVQQAYESRKEGNLRDFEYSLSYALADYKLSAKYVETVKEEGILKKVSSIENLIL